MRQHDARGFTLIEITVVLVVLTLLAGFLLPSLGGFNSLARSVRLREDLGTLCSMLKVMLDDLGESSFYTYGDSYSWGGGGSYGYASATSSGSAGRTVVEQRTEQFGAGGAVMEAGHLHSDYDADGWCDGCNMPSSQCSLDCVDDCDENCPGYEVQQVASVTTQTYSFESGGQSSSSYYAYRSGGYGGYGTAYSRAYGYPVGLLVGDGDIPGSAIGATPWQLPFGATFSQGTDGLYPQVLHFTVDSFDQQLISRDPTFAYGGLDPAAAYGMGSGQGGMYGVGYGNDVGIGSGTSFRWRGPYIADRVSADPWGNRYMANVFALHIPASGTTPAMHNWKSYQETFFTATVCYSAGPNEQIETYFKQPVGWRTGGDDVTAVLAGAGGIR